jgi:hypothetical protein
MSRRRSVSCSSPNETDRRPSSQPVRRSRAGRWGHTRFWGRQGQYWGRDACERPGERIPNPGYDPMRPSGERVEPRKLTVEQAADVSPAAIALSPRCEGNSQDLHSLAIWLTLKTCPPSPQLVGGEGMGVRGQTRATALTSESRIPGTTPAPFGRESRAEKVDSRASSRCYAGGYRLAAFMRL